MSEAQEASLARRAAAEGLGTAILLATVVGSGIMGERLCGGIVGLALLANTLATGAVLVALILALGAISGAHLNPAVSFGAVLDGGLSGREARYYIGAQLLGAVAGVALAEMMFEVPVFSLSTRVRSGWGQVLSEFVATFGLLAVIAGTSRSLSTAAIAVAVGAYITAAYWFTASTSFANPAVTIARSLTDTFAGIRSADVPAFVFAQLGAAVAATMLFRWLAPVVKPRSAAAEMVPGPRAVA